MRKSVKFKNSNFDMAGNLYLPEDFNENQKYQAVVCVHPGGGVKEQVAGLYAQKLSENGFIALAFDASHQGESGGEPRYLENPTARVEDVRCAVDYLSTLPFVDVEKIGALGICAGGGYAVNSALTEKRRKAVAGISSVDIGAFFRGDGTEGSTQANIETLKQVAHQRTLEANGAEPMYLTYVPSSEDEITEDTMVLLKEAYDYYRTPRAQHPNSTNKFLFQSVDKIIAFTAFYQVDKLLSQPLLMIAGSDADTRGFSETAYEMANCEKELFLVDGATHIALYDTPEYVKQVTNKLVEFFSKNL